MKKFYGYLFIFIVLSASLFVSVQPAKALGDFWVSRTPVPNGYALSPSWSKKENSQQLVHSAVDAIYKGAIVFSEH